MRDLGSRVVSFPLVNYISIRIAALRRHTSLSLKALILLGLFLAASAHHASAQAMAAGQAHAEEDGAVTPDATTNDSGPVGIVPLVHGFNASLISTSQYDGAAGWSSLLEPSLAYRFTPHLSVFGGTTAYAYVRTPTVVTNRKGKSTTSSTAMSAHTFVLGDTLLNGTYEFGSHLVDYAGTGTLGLPTGNDRLGLGAGQVTWNIDNHFDHPVTDWLTPELELGLGDSQNLTNQRVTRGYTAVGLLTHMQAGVSVSFPHDINLSSDAYEDLPLGPQTVTSRTGKGKKAAQAASGSSSAGIGEDNGFVNSLDLAVTGHITLSGIYNYSLRNNDSIGGVAVTFLLRPTPKDTP